MRISYEPSYCKHSTADLCGALKYRYIPTQPCMAQPAGYFWYFVCNERIFFRASEAAKMQIDERNPGKQYGDWNRAFLQFVMCR